MKEKILEFISAYLHYILYIRNIYPATAFESTTLYQIPVKRIAHPVLKEYVASFVQNCADYLESIHSIYLVILSNQVVTEKYTLRVKFMSQSLNNTQEESLYLRMFLLKLSCLDSMLSPVLEPVEWKLYIELDGEENRWNTTGFHSVEAKVEIHEPVVPLKSLYFQNVKMELLFQSKYI
jgi:hypothetical protein